MANDNLVSIEQQHSRKILGSVSAFARSRMYRHSPGGQAGFKHILSQVYNRSSINRFKTRGLTIADYRAQPVFSKSRFKPQPPSTTNVPENRALKQIPALPSPAAINTKYIKNTSLTCPPKRPVDSAKPPEPNIQQPASIRTERQIIENTARKAAAKYSLPTGLITAVIRAESNFQVNAVSHAGAKGLMQLMPATAKELGVTDIFDIEQNIDGGAKYLRWMLDRFGGNVRKALAAYNAGPGAVIKYNGRVPYPETRQYVNRVLRFTKQST